MKMDGMLWECAKSNTVQTPRGNKIRYAMLLGFSPGEDEVVPIVVHDQDDDTWRDNILGETDTILRRIPGEEPTFRVYDWNKDSSTWQQRLEDA
jgi:hypothetical protein